MQIFSASVTSTAYRVTRTMTGVECDVCHKIIPVRTRCRQDNEGRYFEVTTGHRDWGLESPESIETLDICPECVGKYISDYLKGCSDTGYVNVETEVVWARKKSEVVDNPPQEGETTKESHDCGWY